MGGGLVGGLVGGVVIGVVGKLVGGLAGGLGVVLLIGLVAGLIGGVGGGVGSGLDGGLDDGLPGGVGGGLVGGLGVWPGVGLDVDLGDRVRRRGTPSRYQRRFAALPALDPQRPPQFAEYLLYFLPKTTREPLLGDLEEEYRAIYKKFGKRRATVWYYVQVALSFYPLVASGVKRLIRWGVLGWIGGVVRRLLP